MKKVIKAIVKRIFSKRAINLMRNNIHIFEKTRTRRIFEASDSNREFLDISLLKELQGKYPQLPEYGYDENSIEKRGAERSKEILNLPGALNANSYLELGCWDGMVSYMLSQKGKKAVAIDKTDEGFDRRVLNSSVKLVKMDAAEMQFNDESFDFVFSFDSFEHFADPEKVLMEAIRVAKKDRYIYLSFGPLYLSPFGAHAYRSIKVPYCHILFSKETLDSFVLSEGLPPVDFGHLNFWTLDQYRALWNKFSDKVKMINYREVQSLEHTNLIRNFTGCFKNKSVNFDNFIISYLQILFQKISS